MSHKLIGRVVFFFSLGLAVALAALVLHRLDSRPRTDDAVVTANTITVAPEVSGRIVTLNVRDDAVVHAGDVLFTIDAEPYVLNLARARAAVQSLEAEISLTDRRVSSQVTSISVAKAQADAARSRLREATDKLNRIEPLLPNRYVTPQEVDVARTTKATAESDLSGALSATLERRQGVGDSRSLAAQLQGARAQVGQAERDLRNTVVRAPFDGRIVGVTTAIGQLVSPARALFTLIETSQWYVMADFRESELSRIRPGQRVTAFIMSQPDVRLSGTVESIGSAVAQREDLTIAGVPPVERDLNWVRIAQRFPVRITLQNPPPSLMRIGASAVAVIHHDRR